MSLELGEIYRSYNRLTDLSYGYYPLHTPFQVIRDCCRRIQKLQAGARADESAGNTNSSDPEARIEELRQIIRKSETEKTKAEAKLEILKDGGSECY